MTSKTTIWELNTVPHKTIAKEIMMTWDCMYSGWLTRNESIHDKTTKYRVYTKVTWKEASHLHYQ
jgi:hypothetical protein